MPDRLNPRHMLEEGVELANEVVACWERGDLAGAVNALELWADDVRTMLAEDADTEAAIACADQRVEDGPDRAKGELPD